MSLRYEQPQALRRALEDRLKTQAQASGLPLDRLRKEAAFERLLARLAATTPYGNWALKGGLAMLARAGARARATADAGTTWRGQIDQLSATLERAAASDLADHFRFLIGTPNALRGEGPDRGLRFPIESRLAGRTFEPIRLDGNISPNDPRPIEELRLRNHFAFAGLPDVVVSAIGAPQQLAEKLHAYTRDYGAADNTRAKDLYDMLIIAADLGRPTARRAPGRLHHDFCLTPHPVATAAGPAATHLDCAVGRVRPRLPDHLSHARSGLRCPAHFFGRLSCPTRIETSSGSRRPGHGDQPELRCITSSWVSSDAMRCCCVRQWPVGAAAQPRSWSRRMRS
ncbi:MAG TPA: nucleotidyl transferase AbiEii/AbiGii toxin family protein [Jatrophihabitantaceae bacterium]